MAERRILNGYPDGTFRPDSSVTRAEFAAIVAAVFNVSVKHQYINFTDVPSNFWATGAIKKAYETGFLSGLPDKTFRPTNQIYRGDVLVWLVNGLEIATNIKPDLVEKLGQIYRDAANIPSYAHHS